MKTGILPNLRLRTTPRLLTDLRSLFQFSVVLFLFSIPVLEMGRDHYGRIIEWGCFMILYLVICLRFFRVWRELNRRIPEK